jgi:putative addiction module component (TIGR02574 family)
MSREQLLAEILQLPPEERQGLIQEAIDSLPGELTDRDMTPALRAELDRRYQEMLDHPERGSPWEDVSKRIRARKK